MSTFEFVVLCGTVIFCVLFIALMASNITETRQREETKRHWITQERKSQDPESLREALEKAGESVWRKQ